jgi:pSer/pThr/pTyr-binding forkhead associated (FHA) protein
MRSSPALSTVSEVYYEIPLADMPATIGRSVDADICLADRWVSRRHCQIERLEDSVLIRDLGSSHGTYVNGHRVDEFVLKSGDRLGVGLTSFVASVDDHGLTLAGAC